MRKTYCVTRGHTHYASRITLHALRITHYALRFTHYALRQTPRKPEDPKSFGSFLNRLLTIALLFLYYIKASALSAAAGAESDLAIRVKEWMMRRKVKLHAQSDFEEKKKGAKAPVRSLQTATAAYRASPTANGLRELSPMNMTMLQRTVGNRAVTDMISRREGEEDELSYPGPRGGREAETEDELDYPGPRRL
jgi:hypothetical protein